MILSTSECSSDMMIFKKNNEEYNPNKKRKMLTYF